ncbi:hypothetical protein [Deinococcus sp. Marseille-Q6407]|uniref:hypothetical protein n=1 Tax=Deinococcus sp. Marseille-Q6407 TaxID=2969223 RepID=UPI0021C16665|nr:hypothetical protein [Deinococcus sp. Marseille-Q6407]
MAAWRGGRGLGYVVNWAGLAWLSLPFVLLDSFLWLAGSGDFGFSVSGEGWTFYSPSTLAGKWLAAAELLTLWLGPGLALLWWGRRLRAGLEA